MHSPGRETKQEVQAMEERDKGLGREPCDFSQPGQERPLEKMALHDLM